MNISARNIVILTIVGTFLLSVVPHAFAQVPALEPKVNDSDSSTPSSTAESIGKLTIKISDKDTLEIDLPYKNGDTYKIISK